MNTLPGKLKRTLDFYTGQNCSPVSRWTATTMAPDNASVFAHVILSFIPEVLTWKFPEKIIANMAMTTK